MNVEGPKAYVTYIYPLMFVLHEGEELSDQVVIAKFATTTQHGAIAGKTQTHMME